MRIERKSREMFRVDNYLYLSPDEARRFVDLMMHDDHSWMLREIHNDPIKIDGMDLCVSLNANTVIYATVVVDKDEDIITPELGRVKTGTTDDFLKDLNDDCG